MSFNKEQFEQEHTRFIVDFCDLLATKQAIAVADLNIIHFLHMTGLSVEEAVPLYIKAMAKFAEAYPESNETIQKMAKEVIDADECRSPGDKLH